MTDLAAKHAVVRRTEARSHRGKRILMRLRKIGSRDFVEVREERTHVWFGAPVSSVYESIVLRGAQTDPWPAGADHPE